MYLRLHLRFFAWITSIASRVAVSTISPNRLPEHPPPKYTTQYTWVEVAGFEPAS